MPKSKAKRTKRYNPAKQANRDEAARSKQFSEVFSKICIVCNLLNMEKSHIVLPPEAKDFSKKEIQKRLFEHSHSWTVYCAVCMYEPNAKKNNLKVWETGVNTPVVFKEIAGQVEKTHKEMLYSYSNRLNIVTGYAFLSCPSEHEWSMEELEAAFAKADCFNPDMYAFMNDKGHIEFKEREPNNG